VRDFIASIAAEQCTGNCSKRFTIATSDLVTQQAANHGANSGAHEVHIGHVILYRMLLRCVSGFRLLISVHGLRLQLRDRRSYGNCTMT
jgi:hypothetical protein